MAATSRGAPKDAPPSVDFTMWIAFCCCEEELSKLRKVT